MPRLRSPRTTWSLAAALILAVALGAACGDDDGATVRETGSVRIVGDPPPEGGGSVSATGSGCTTKGATNKLPAATLEVSLFDDAIRTAASQPAGVTEVVVKNQGDAAHELVIVPESSAAARAVAAGAVDDATLAAGPLWRIAAFPRNTICRGIFDLPAGSYVLFDSLSEAGTSNIGRGMVAKLTLT
jgi:hypothetical protein